MISIVNPQSGQNALPSISLLLCEGRLTGRGQIYGLVYVGKPLHRLHQPAEANIHPPNGPIVPDERNG